MATNQTKEALHMKKALIVVTNHARFDGTNRATGVWFSEATHFHDVMRENGIAVDYVSPTGGYVPLDPGSLTEIDDLNWRYYGDADYRQQALAHSLRPDQVNPADYNVIYYAGGHGVMWDFPESTAIAQIAQTIYQNGGLITAVCHGVVGLLAVKNPDGTAFINGKPLTGFTNEEEALNQLTDKVPFLAEDALKKAGAQYSKAAAFTENVVVADRLITGQNPQSAKGIGLAVIKQLRR